MAEVIINLLTTVRAALALLLEDGATEITEDNEEILPEDA
jgi:hypothetical protein